MYCRGGSRIFIGGGAPVFFFQNTSCIRKPLVISGRGGCAPLHPTPYIRPCIDNIIDVSTPWGLGVITTSSTYFSQSFKHEVNKKGCTKIGDEATAGEAFLSPEPPVPLSLWGLCTRKRWLMRNTWPDFNKGDMNLAKQIIISKSLCYRAFSYDIMNNSHIGGHIVVLPNHSSGNSNLFL